MKTFIWNTEYTVLVCNAETEPAARTKLRAQLGVQFVDGVIDGDPNGTAKESRCSSAINQLESHLLKLKSPPDYVLDPDKALVYEHENS